MSETSSLIGWAVTDGPTGTAWTRLPASRLLAGQLKAEYNNTFWCSTVTRGCGNRLTAAVGEHNRPHFRHQPGEAARCSFYGAGEEAERSYLHLALQQALLAWLQGQGLDPTMEKNLPEFGRADVFVKTGTLAQTLEVQLSQIHHHDWVPRNATYARQVNVVTWLWGPAISASTVRSQFEPTGLAFHIRLKEGTTAGSPEDPASVDIGTDWRGGRGWTDLASCELRADGLWTPYVDKAREIQARHLARMRLLKAAADQAEAARAKRGSLGGAGSRRTTHAPPPTYTEPADPELPLNLARPTLQQGPRGSGRLPLTTWGWLALGQPPEALQALPESLRYAGHVMAHIVTRIEISGSVSALSFPDLVDGQQIQETLIAAGLIETYEIRGILRWRRTS